MSVEDAMVEAENLGITTSAEHIQEDTSAEEKIFNFGVYKYGRDRTSLSRRILQVTVGCMYLVVLAKVGM